MPGDLEGGLRKASSQLIQPSCKRQGAFSYQIKQANLHLDVSKCSNLLCLETSMLQWYNASGHP